VFEKIRKMSIGKFAVLLALVSVITYVAFKEILMPRLMNSSIAVNMVKESAMDKEYRDKILKQMYDGYLRKMAGME
jgi:hypothetical protein